MTIDDQRNITIFRFHNQITGDIKTIMDILKNTIPSLDGLELEQVSGKLHHLSVLLNGLYGILGYDSPDEAFADVVDYEIVDQLKWLEVLRNQMGAPADINDGELLRLASEIDEAIWYIAALEAIRDDNVEMFVRKLCKDSIPVV